MWRRIKKTLVQDPIVLAAPLQTNLEMRPVSQTILSPPGFDLDTVQKVALGLLLIPSAVGFIASLLTAAWVLLAITGVLLLLVGLMFWVIKLRAQMFWKATWHRDTVEVEDGRYGATEFWVEPLSAFAGLKRDFGLIPRGNSYTPDQQVWGLLLAHPDPNKSVLLHASYETIKQDTIKYYEEQLSKKLLND